MAVSCSKSNDSGGNGGTAPASPITTKSPTSAPVESAVKGGQDVRADFLTNYAGDYQLAGLKGQPAGIPPGAQKLTINADGSYSLAVSEQEIQASDKSVTAKCTYNETGDVTQVRGSPEEVKVGDRVMSSSGFKGVIVLRPLNTEVVKAENVLGQDVKEARPTSAAITSLCSRKDDRVLMVEDFLPDALLVSGMEPDGKDSFFLHDRLLARDKGSWLWLDGDLAKTAVMESQKFVATGAKGLEVDGDAVKSLEQKNNESALTVKASMEDSRVNLDIGTTAVSTYLPVMNVTGTLRGVSYQPSTGWLVYNLSDYTVTPIFPRLESTSGLNLSIQTTLLQAAQELDAGVVRLQKNAANNLLTVSVNTSSADRIQLRVKPKTTLSQAIDQLSK
jgi:hypothetical protein